MSKRYHRGLPPIVILPLGFLAVVLIGSLLFMLPLSTTSGRGLGLADAVFTATSATCVTGLTTVDVLNELTTFGQIVLITLIQVGGLGFMAIATLLFMMLGKRISLHDRMVLAESFSSENGKISGMVRMCMYAAALTFGTELLGACVLSIRFIPMFGVGTGIYYSVFHSISAFCNAGFDLFGGFKSLEPFAGDYLVLITLMALIVIGGLGFTVVANLCSRRSFSAKRGKAVRLTAHTKLVLVATAALILVGSALFFIFESSSPTVFAGMDTGERALSSFFQSITCRTAGFASVPQGLLSSESKLLSCLLMFIGASPSGTGGGIKTTTLVVFVLFIRATVRGKQDVTLFGRRLTQDTVRRALCILLLAIGVVIVATMGVALFDGGPGITMSDILFEVVSALSTTGLSTGITTSLGNGSLYILSLAMYLGRVGIITFALSLGKIGANDRSKIRYPVTDIPVG